MKHLLRLSIGSFGTALAFLALGAESITDTAQATATSGPAAAESLMQIAERFGLWQAVVIGLIALLVWGYYGMVAYVRDTEITLMLAMHEVMTQVLVALQGAPCRPDSDDLRKARETLRRSPGAKALEVIRQAEERRRKRSAKAPRDD